MSVFPEDGDSGTAAAGAALFNALAVGADFVGSGFDLSDGGSLNVDIAAGVAIIGGVVIISDATETESLTDSTTNYVFLDNTGAFTVNTSGTPPSNSLLLGRVVTSGGSVSSVAHEQNVTGFRNVYIRKASDETVNNSSTLQDDDDFAFAVEAGQIYEILMLLEITEPTSSTPDFKFAWTGVDGRVCYFGMDRDDWGTPSAKTQDANFDAVIACTASDGNPKVLVQGHLIATADGTAQFQWAQDTANASDTTLTDNSILVARRCV